VMSFSGFRRRVHVSILPVAYSAAGVLVGLGDRVNGRQVDGLRA